MHDNLFIPKFFPRTFFRNHQIHSNHLIYFQSVNNYFARSSSEHLTWRLFIQSFNDPLVRSSNEHLIWRPFIQSFLELQWTFYPKVIHSNHLMTLLPRSPMSILCRDHSFNHLMTILSGAPVINLPGGQFITPQNSESRLLTFRHSKPEPLLNET